MPGPNEASHLIFAQSSKDSQSFTQHWAEYKAAQQVRWDLLAWVKKKISEFISHWHRLKGMGTEY